MSTNTDPITETITESNVAPITETITEPNIDEIVETLTNDEGTIYGYACKQVLEDNVAEDLDLIFYMDVLTPKGAAEASNATTTAASSVVPVPQEAAIDAAQEVILREMARNFQIDAEVNKGVRCFDLPVDGSTYIVQMTVERQDFREETLFGGCRELEWDSDTQECKFYEGHVKGKYIGNVATGQDGTPFGDAVGVLTDVIDGNDIAQQIAVNYQGEDANLYNTAFLGVPRIPDDPNFQGSDQGKDVLKERANSLTGVSSSQMSKQNRTTITVVGGLLVACFAIAFALMGYILYQRRRSYRQGNNDRSMADGDHLELEPSAMPYDDVDKGDSHDDDDLEQDGTDDQEEEDEDILEDDEPYNQRVEEYPDLPMSAEAIQMDLGNALRGQLMGQHGGGGPPAPAAATYGGVPLRNSFLSPERGDDSFDPDEADSWAQTDGTIGSLELQLEPITAEV